jgi:ATP/maltotriose-dependent transcriptional regulator MalT
MSNLRFDEDELSQFLAFHENVSLTNDEIKTVINRTEGWVLAIRMILLAKSFETIGNKKDDIKDLSNNLDDILSFVSDNLNPKFFRLMQLCALCEQFNVTLIDSICGFAFQDSCTGEELLAKLKELNFFIIPTKEHGGWYRFHHLVGEVLIQRLKKSDPDSIIPLYNFISEWFSDKGLVNEAIHYAIQAKNYALACKHIIEHGASLFKKGHWWVVQRWLDKIPRQIRNVNIDIMLTELLICEETWSLEDFFSILETLRSIGIENLSEENLSRYLYHLGYFLTFVKPDPKKAIEVLERSKAMFYDESYMFGARREVILACSRQMHGFGTLALNTLEEIIEKFDVSSIMNLRAIHGKVLVNLLSGNFESANNDSKKLLFLIQDSDMLNIKGWCFYFRGNVAFQSYHKDHVLQFFKETLEFEGLLNYRAYFDALAGLVLINSLQKDRKATAFFLEKMRQMVVNFKDTSFQYYYKSVKARVYWHIGQGNKELSWAITDWVKQHPSSYLFLIEVPELTKLRIVISHGSQLQVKQAISVLEEVGAMLNSVNNHYQLIDIILLKAMGFFRLGENKRAAKCLEEALILADKKDMIRPILEATLVMPSLFSVLENTSSYHILSRINFDFVNQKTLKVDLSDSYELSLREQELIRHIYRGLRNKEVADQLNISVLTVKTHLRNIYRKLDVSSRTSMINKILEKNIFSL